MASGIRAIGKALTTPNRIFDGMRAAIEVAAQEIGLDGKTLLSKSDMLIYGTTRATNAVVTKSTAKTAFLTTRGFRDVLVLKEGGKYDPHDYSYDYPPPYIPRRYTFEIDERVDAQGNVVRRARPQSGARGHSHAGAAQIRGGRGVPVVVDRQRRSRKGNRPADRRGTAGRPLHAVA